ncbi:VCBS repeat-containing protein [Sphaerisporangium sp. B11E5]|uniref:FG-GAP repeat domain-containing protein n=1 Tax=Sphaerisporangium sp. B11E5 TaxID=3153563 RepID=UPI00325CCCCA
MALAAGAALAFSPAAAADPVPRPAPAEVDAARTVAPCDPAGPNSTDSRLAAELNGKLTAKLQGYMSAYRVSCARMVVKAVKDRGLHLRAAVIAITTTIVESSIENIDVELDHDSLGLFQQRATWGTRDQRLDPIWATNAFLNKMLSEYPNNTWLNAPIGEVCQSVQVSAFPERYQPEAGDAQIIVDAIIASAEAPAPPAGDAGVRADFNGDGRDDVAGLYDYGDASAALWVWTAGQDGSLQAPVRVWQSGTWDAARTKVVGGDFNGDGRGDVGALYDYGDASAALWVWTAGQGGAFQAPVRVWQSGTWDAARTKLVGGDFNGDGRDDVGALYDYGNASSALWSWSATSTGILQAPVRVWQSGTWDAARTKVVGGDFNGDGRDDVGALYDYGNASSALWSWSATSTGILQAPVRVWQSGTWDATRTKLVGGDFNGDGRDDVGALYDYGNASSALWSWTATSTGILQAPVRVWQSGTWDATRTKLVGGDFNGDGRDDVGALYDYGNASSALWTWTATSTGTLQAPVRAWQSATWDATRTKLL